MFNSALRLAILAIAWHSLRTLSAHDVGEAAKTQVLAMEPAFAEVFKAQAMDSVGLIDDAQQELNLAGELGELRARLDTLEKVVQENSSPATKTEVKSTKLQCLPADNPKDNWSVKLGGHIQLDYVTWADADPAIVDAENYFSYRRLRLVADGVGYEQFDFRLQLTLEPGPGSADDIFSSAEVKDAYVSMNEIPVIGRVRLGNFFVPFSLEQVTNDTKNLFTERSIPTEGIFAASREVGVAFYNCTIDQRITWTGGIFFNDINDRDKTRFDDNQGTRLSGRLTWLPYYDAISEGRYLIHTGVGVLYTDDHDDRVRFGARPQIQRGPVLIDSGSLAAGSYTTGNLEFAMVYGSVTVQSEAFLSDVSNLLGDSSQFRGAYAHVSCFLTGENRVFEPFGQHGAQFGTNKPNRNFNLSSGGSGPGAWEAKARWSNLDLADVNRGEYNDLTVGVNWYWSDHTRWMFDWIHPITSSSTVFGATDSDLFVMRFDVNW